MRGISLALSTLAAAALAPQLWAQETAPPIAAAIPTAPERVPDVIAISPDENSRMTIPVSIAGKGPYAFLVDTGAERTVISTELASRLALGAGRSVRLHSMTEVANVETRLIPQLQISKSAISDVHAPSLPAANLGAAGMLGVDSLKSQRVIFDFKKKTMSVTPSEKRQANWGPDVIVVTGKSLYGRLILVNARLDGEKIVVVLDTGSQITIGNRALRERLQAKRKLRKTFPVELMSVTGGTMNADYTQIRRISIGGLTITNMPIGFAEVHPFKQLKLQDTPAILLGMDALKLFDKVSVDFARKEVRFLAPDGSGSSDASRMVQVGARPSLVRS